MNFVTELAGKYIGCVYLHFRSGTFPAGIRRLGDGGLSLKKKTVQSKWTLIFLFLKEKDSDLK
jgi:hypothetical protein